MTSKTVKSTTYFHTFEHSTTAYTLPKKFTFPFYYEPHPLCIVAAKKLQNHLINQKEWVHNFGIEPNKAGMVIGKMFGVLVVQNEQKNLGYLAAFSGKLAGKNHHTNFVPPIFDMLTEDGFFRKEELVLNELNRQIEIIEKDPAYVSAIAAHETEKSLSINSLEKQKANMRAAKKVRKQRRQTAKQTHTPSQLAELEASLSQESIKGHFYLKDLNKYWKERLAKSEKNVAIYTKKLVTLKQERKSRSNALQQKLFDQYQFLNKRGQTKSLLDIFQPTIQKTPPAGAGECAAPKLLQYAFQHQLTPIAMAEFWWGQSPKSEIRRHGQFYPACRGKCEPILAHMLSGMEMDDNPMLKNPAVGKVLQYVYEDEYIAVINKPAEFFSVPGKNIQDSVFLRIRQKYPHATGPIIVHRLDMSTSGLMIIAKSKETHKYLQYQFLKRTIKKRYVALLNGELKEKEGIIDLPLRVDLDNRPQQLVCYEHGKAARTKWKVVDRTNGQTRIHFFPITGRTHQLRVHAAHPAGLNTPIVGDDLYGIKGKRLHLHAEWIEFKHPYTKEIMSFEVGAEF